VLDDELTSAEPAVFLNSLDFGTDPYDDPADRTLLTDGGERMAGTPNAGGSSLLSEVFALEVLARCEGATLLKTETEIDYDAAGTKITDMLVQIDGEKIGVSVVRAFHYPPSEPYPPADAETLLTRKLTDIQESSAHVVEADRWRKQILAVLAYDEPTADVWNTVLPTLSTDVRGDTIVLVTVTDGADDPIY
jgi:hypothetical protein